MSGLKGRVGMGMRNRLSTYAFPFDEEQVHHFVFHELSETIDEALGNRFLLLEKLQRSQEEKQLKQLQKIFKDEINRTFTKNMDYSLDEMIARILEIASENIDEVTIQILHYPVVADEMRRVLQQAWESQDNNEKTEEILNVLVCKAKLLDSNVKNVPLLLILQFLYIYNRFCKCLYYKLIGIV